MSHGSSRWSGAGPLVGTAVEWLIQAVDGAGNVAVTGNKAVHQVGRARTDRRHPWPVPTGTADERLVHGDRPDVTISGAPGITYSLDGAPFTLAAPR